MLNSVGYLGPQGTNSEEVCTSLFSQAHYQLQPYPTIDACIRAVANGEVSESLVPIENSLEGSVNITMDTLAHNVNLFITQEIVWPIHHYLMAAPELKQVDTIASHPQALAQCRNYLLQHYPDATLKSVDSTAEAARLCLEEHNCAAIANLQASHRYHLKVLSADIQDNSQNCTRFVALSRNPGHPDPAIPCKTSIICKILGNKPGSLCAILQEFVNYSVNLVKIESRPARTGLGEYIFFLDMEGNIAQENLKAALEKIQQKSLWVKNLGSYPYDNKATSR